MLRDWPADRGGEAPARSPAEPRARRATARSAHLSGTSADDAPQIAGGRQASQEIEKLEILFRARRQPQATRRGLERPAAAIRRLASALFLRRQERPAERRISSKTGSADHLGRWRTLAELFALSFALGHFREAKNLLTLCERGGSGWSRNRTGDTRFFRPLLYQLSYPAIPTNESAEVAMTKSSRPRRRAVTMSASF